MALAILGKTSDDVDVKFSVSMYIPPTPDVTDSTPPVISCDEPSELWSDTNITIACTALDADSGLQNATDASFTVSTNVDAGTETNDAYVNQRRICDNAGNCAYSEAIGGIKVDRKTPVVGCLTEAPLTWSGVDISIRCIASDRGVGFENTADDVIDARVVKKLIRIEISTS